MPKDYKHRVPNTWRAPKRRRRSIWIWLAPLVLLVGGIASFALIRSPDGTEATDEAAAEKPAVVEKAKSELAVKGKAGAPADDNHTKSERSRVQKRGASEPPPDIELPEPRFTFYKILPEKEVIVSDRDIRSLKRKEKAGKTAPVPGGFVIQVGAYSKLEDAERTRSRLSAAKVKAKMEKVLIDRVTWYRVKLGPYNTLAEAEKVRLQLRKQRIDSVLQQSIPNPP